MAVNRVFGILELRHVMNTSDITSRYSFASQFLHSTFLFAADAATIELQPPSNPDDDGYVRHRAFVTAAIMHATATLESVIAELWEYGPGHHLGSKRTDEQARQLLQALMTRSDRASVLKKYCKTLSALEKEQMDIESQVHRHADLLRQLRNSLVHYKSQWEEQIDESELFAELKQLGHKPPSFAPTGRPLFPSHYLGAECALWAADTTIAFLDQFFLLLEAPNPLEPHRARFAAARAEASRLLSAG